MEQETLLEMMNDDIKMLKNIMYDIKKLVNDFSDPLLVRVSQVLDVKLNQRDQLIKNIDNRGRPSFKESKNSAYNKTTSSI